MDCQNCNKLLEKRKELPLRETQEMLMLYSCIDGHRDHQIIPMSKLQIKENDRGW